MTKVLTARTFESAFLFAIAFFVTVLLHETAHAVVGHVVGRGPILFTGHVDCVLDKSVGDRVATAAAGPLFSGVSGVVFFLVARAGLRAMPRLRLFTAWLGYHGLVNVVGYVFSAWFAADADVGRIVRLVGVPTAGQIAMMVVALAALRAIARPFGTVFAALTPVPLTDEKAAKAWALEIGVLAGFLALPPLVLAVLPAPHWLSLVYCLLSPFSLFDLPDALAARRNVDVHAPLSTARPVAVAFAFVALVSVARLALDDGWPVDAVARQGRAQVSSPSTAPPVDEAGSPSSAH
jgi:hypothetical protein